MGPEIHLAECINMCLADTKNVLILFYCYYVTLYYILLFYVWGLYMVNNLFQFAWGLSSFSCESLPSLKTPHFQANRDALYLCYILWEFRNIEARIKVKKFHKGIQNTQDQF